MYESLHFDELPEILEYYDLLTFYSSVPTNTYATERLNNLLELTPDEIIGKYTSNRKCMMGHLAECSDEARTDFIEFIYSNFVLQYVDPLKADKKYFDEFQIVIPKEHDYTLKEFDDDYEEFKKNPSYEIQLKLMYNLRFAGDFIMEKRQDKLYDIIANIDRNNKFIRLYLGT
jgi:hypothetical protein